MQQHDDDDFGAILAAFEAEQQASAPERKAPKVGDMAKGKVVSITDEAVFVELGGKAEGMIPAAELRNREGEIEAAVGGEIEALIAGTDPDSGMFVLRVRGGRGGRGTSAPAGLAEISQAHVHGMPIEGTVQEVVKGGVSVQIAGVRAFCPISQLDLRFVQDPSGFVGQRYEFRVTKCEERPGRGPDVVVSRRALLEEEQRERAQATRATLRPGAHLKGKVTSLTTYGAFVDLGGLEGLIHVSELSHSRVEHAQEVLSEGQEVEVEVLRIEPGKDGKGERISLSRKALLDDPWKAFVGSLAVGTRFRGKVVRLQPFGAFIEIAPGVDGLLHISELSGDRHISHPKEVLKVGDDIDVLVREIDIERKRLSLVRARDEGGDMGEHSGTSGGAGFGAMGNFFGKRQDSES
jgi:small subunit ribosomal protein S1